MLEYVPIGNKTTMRIGGNARYYAELTSREDVEEAWKKAQKLNVPLIPLGAGSNTIFDDGEINALVIRMKADTVQVNGNIVVVKTGKNLAMLLNELAKQNLDLSPLTGIPGTMGGAIFGNAGQGSRGTWLDTFVESVTFFHAGEWRTFSRAQCEFGYRESVFKRMDSAPILWETTLALPVRPRKEVEVEVETLLKKRMETQPHNKTAGSVFKATGETPAWKLIDAAGLRGKKFGDIEISEKHANFFLNSGDGTFADVCQAIYTVRDAVAEPLEVEMRLYLQNGSVVKNV